MAKSLSDRTKLKHARDHIIDLEGRIQQLEIQLEEEKKKVKSAEDSKDSWYKTADRKEKEIDQIQTFLDTVPNAIARRGEGEYSDRSPMTRLAAWLASYNMSIRKDIREVKDA